MAPPPPRSQKGPPDAPPPPPPRSQKGPPDEIVKYLRWYKNSRVMVRLTISMHFQQFKDLKFRIFSGGACPPTPPKKTLAECPSAPN